MITISLTKGLDKEESRKILQFCLDQGADSFTVNFLYTPGDQSEEEMKVFFSKLTPFYIGRRKLKQAPVFLDEELAEESVPHKHVDCWEFNSSSLEIILESCGDGIIDYDVCSLPEDWTFYKNRELFLGVISHEDYAFLRLDEGGYQHFIHLGLPHKIDE